MISGRQNLLLAGGCQDQIIFGTDATPGQAFELHAQRRITGLQAGGIDQYDAFAQQWFQRLHQRLARIDMGHRHIENPTKGLELLLGTNTVAVHAHQRDVLRAVLEHVAGSQLGQGGGLAHAGGADHGNHSTLFQRLDFRSSNHPRQVREQHAPGLTRFFDIGNHRQQVARQRTGQADALQATPQVGLGRTAALQLIPRQRAELDFHQFAQAVELETHRVECTRVDSRCSGRCWRRTTWLGVSRLDERFGGGQWQAGEQLAIGGVVALAFAAQAQFGLGGDDPRLGLAQLVFEFHVRNPRRQRRQLVIQRSCQFDPPGDPAVANDGGISAQLIANQLHGLTHIGGEKTLNLHKPLPQPLGPTVATMVTCLLSGISW
ncbi:hypothetical protein D3C81_897330 [compost metagenome]